MEETTAGTCERLMEQSTVCATTTLHILSSYLAGSKDFSPDHKNDHVQR